jgi:hypothetical protein
MTGTVTPNLRSTQYHFEYGTTTAYGSSTPDGDAGAGGAAVPVSAPATGLTPATTYHYRLVATSADGTAAGADMTFTTANPLPLDTVAPVFSGVSVTNKVFKVGPAGTAVSARKRRTKVGTTFRFTLSETATVKIAIQRAAQGRRKGKRCVKPTRKLHRAKKCTRFTAAGTLTRSGQAGANTVPFSGRIGRKKLGPGTYRARLIATDAAGNRSLTKTLKFKIVRR